MMNKQAERIADALEAILAQLQIIAVNTTPAETPEETPAAGT